VRLRNSLEALVAGILSRLEWKKDRASIEMAGGTR
jgi:hypothetical protein